MGIGFEEFELLARNNKVISNYAELDLTASLSESLAQNPSSGTLDPAAIYAELRKHSADAFMFESVEGSEKFARYTFIGYKPLAIMDSGSYDELACALESLESQAQLNFFHKGYVGFFSFESVADIEPSLSCARANQQPMYMQLVGSMIVFDRVLAKIFLIANSRIGSASANCEFRVGYENSGSQIDELKFNYQETEAKLKELETLIKQAKPLAPLDIDLALNLDDLLKRPKAVQFSSNTGKEKFCEMVVKAKNHILEGDAFQIVLSHKLSANLVLDPLLVYRILRQVNPSPYLFIYNARGYALVGSSPEMLVKSTKDSSGDYFAEIRPIAGTYPRGKSPAEDKANEEALLRDTKEIAEHVMLIDLARNDLGRVAEAGSVTVAQRMIVEKYSHVMHIVSSVVAKLKVIDNSNRVKAKVEGESSGVSATLGVKLVKACFPAGTLSGAPKIEAINIITELEAEPRRSYGGAIGYFSLDGLVDSAIMIRTLRINASSVEVQAGAGIVADSNPDSEYQETYNKANALIKVVNLCAQSPLKANC